MDDNMLFALKTIVAALIISFGSGISKKLPGLAGFIIALPIASLIALAFSYAEHESPQASITFAKSIFAAVPISLFFLSPFYLRTSLTSLFGNCTFLVWHCWFWVFSFISSFSPYCSKLT